MEVAILGGNDFTAPHLTRCARYLYFNEYRGKFKKLASLVNENGSAENCPQIGSLIVNQELIFFMSIDIFSVIFIIDLSLIKVSL